MMSTSTCALPARLLRGQNVIKSGGHFGTTPAWSDRGPPALLAYGDTLGGILRDSGA